MEKERNDLGGSGKVKEPLEPGCDTHTHTRARAGVLARESWLCCLRKGWLQNIVEEGDRSGRAEDWPASNIQEEAEIRSHQRCSDGSNVRGTHRAETWRKFPCKYSPHYIYLVQLPDELNAHENSILRLIETAAAPNAGKTTSRTIVYSTCAAWFRNSDQGLSSAKHPTRSI